MNFRWGLDDALHLAHLIATHGYIFPIDDHILAVKNDNTYYRFQVSLRRPIIKLRRQFIFIIVLPKGI